MLIVFGSVNADLVFQVPALPRPGETVLCPGFTTMPGGKGANQAVAAARAGSRVRFFGAVGDDGFGPAMRANLEQHGIDCQGLATVPGSTGVAVIGVEPGGENSIIVGSGANLAVTAELVPDDLLGAGTTLLCQNEVPAGATFGLLGRARARGVRTILNLAPAAALSASELAAVSLLVVNEHEAATLTGEHRPVAAIRALLDDGLDAVLVTLGPAGILGGDAGALFEVPSLAVEVVDSTGAGDAFVGVLAAGIDAGLGLERAARRAVVGGALACESLGAQSASPDKAAIDAREPGLGPSRRPA